MHKFLLKHHTQTIFYLFFVVAGLTLSLPAYAYVGPGAGFAFLGSAFVLVLTIAMTLFTILIGPLVWAYKRLRGSGIPKSAKARRVVVIGLDGLEPKLVDRFIAEKKLANFSKLAAEGSYSRLKTTLPALSPVAWATFQTGVNPGAHNIFDFLTRDKRFCLPELSSTKTSIKKKSFSIGPFSWTKYIPSVRLLRMSKPFWKILGEYGIFSNILRVPISYPAEKFNGNILSAMCTPDLRGTQGSFTLFSTKKIDTAITGGWYSPLTRRSDTSNQIFEGIIQGPQNPKGVEKGESLNVPFSLRITKENSAELILQGKKHSLEKNKFTDWIEVEFRFSPLKSIAGIVRFCLREVGTEVALYMSPLNVQPTKPALPISQPLFFAQWLAKRIGSYGTLGLMEDTWGRNELALDDQRFLDQSYYTHLEREQMLFDTLRRTREGLCVCVFDATDRIQHMFWRYLEDNHPSPREGAEFNNTIEELYTRMDDLLGRIRAELSPEDLLIVLSDHGFSSFRRGVNLNTWLKEQGLLVLKEGATTSADYFADVDWSKTKAFAVGLSGLYINRRGREHLGIVDAAEAEQVKKKIIEGLEALRDPKDGSKAFHRVYDSAIEYKGLYVQEAPDLILGYEPGYRVSWDSVTGSVEKDIFSDNTKAWSGDHQVDPSLVPGVLLCNRTIQSVDPHIRDIAPTVLSVFSVPVPSYMEGKAFL